MKPGVLLVLLILVALPYATALNHEFVYDDHGSIAENPFLDNASNIRSLLTLRTLTDPTINDGRRPMVILSYFGDRFIWQSNPFGYHLTNLALHLLAAFLFVQLILRLAPEAPFLAMASGLLFGLHPVLTEAVQVPAFREDLLSSVFALLYLLAALRADAGLWTAIPALLLAVLSKESAVVSPLLLLWLWHCFPDWRPPRKIGVVFLAVSFAISAMFIIVWVHTGMLQASSKDWSGFGLPFPANLFTGPWLWVKALCALALPWPLLADHVVDPITGVGSLPFALGSLAITAWAAAAVFLRRRSSAAAFGLGWVVIAFLPVANLIPLYNPFAERYLYFPAMGFAIVLASLVKGLARPRPRALALGAVCAAYTTLVIARLPVWADDDTLWSRTLAQEPRSARAHTWVALELKRRGQLLDALSHFQEADRLHPSDVSALINIAVIYGQQGRLPDAEKLLREAIRRQPGKADAHWNLAVALEGQNKPDEAMAELRRTLEIDPRHRAALAAAEGASPK
jgi:protein O-mannosyl-transferase